MEWKRTSADLALAKDINWTAPQVVLDHLKYKITGVDHEGRLSKFTVHSSHELTWSP